MVQPQLPAAMVPVPIPLASGYPQPGKAYSSTAPIGYTYPQPVATYASATYPGPPTAAPLYPTQPHISYSPFSVKDPLGPPTTPPAGMSGYPYYIAKQ
ncbi:hypothetical protein U1Q18_012801 [Sarracenia purpurea var. burkii]